MVDGDPPCVAEEEVVVEVASCNHREVVAGMNPWIRGKEGISIRIAVKCDAFRFDRKQAKTFFFLTRWSLFFLGREI